MKLQKGKTNPQFVISLLLASLLGITQAFGDGISSGTSFSSIAGSTCSFSGSGLDSCPLGTVTPAAVVASTLNSVTVAGTTGTGNLVFSINSSFTGATQAQTYRFSAALQGPSSKTLCSATAPTISSGFGTSPTIVQNSGTCSFSINVGTGGTATGGVIGLPAATNEWNCNVTPFNASASQLVNTTIISARTTTSITLANEVTSTGIAAAWPTSLVLMINCVGA